MVTPVVPAAAARTRWIRSPKPATSNVWSATGQNYASAMTVKRVGIVGSGIMGSGVAECAARNGHEVVLRSRRQETADAMVAGLEKSLAKQVERGKLAEDERASILSRVTATSDLGELANCDLVLESIVEELQPKK